FFSRACDGSDHFQRATVRPADNLLIENGDPGVWKPQVGDTPSDVQMVNFDFSSLQDFKSQDAVTDGSSDELALEGMYGDYVLLSRSGELTANPALDPKILPAFYPRFDFLSTDDPPPLAGVASQPQPAVQLDRTPGPITVR